MLALETKEIKYRFVICGAQIWSPAMWMPEIDPAWVMIALSAGQFALSLMRYINQR
jgi:hypothetical protein